MEIQKEVKEIEKKMLELKKILEDANSEFEKWDKQYVDNLVKSDESKVRAQSVKEELLKFGVKPSTVKEILEQTEVEEALEEREIKQKCDNGDAVAILYADGCVVCSGDARRGGDT